MSRLPLVCGECDAMDPLGINVPGVYDGVLFWKCQACGFAWPRSWHPNSHRADIAQSYVDACNVVTFKPVPE